MAPLPAGKSAAELAADQMDNADARTGIEDDIDAGGGDASEGGDDGAGDGEGGGEPQPRARREVAPVSPGDAKRNAIIDRFKRPDMREFDGDMNRPGNIYGEAAEEELEPEAGADEPGVPRADLEARRQQEAEPPQRTHKVTVRGKTVEMTDDQLLAHARKVEAGDSYLEEARQILEEAKVVRAERTGQDRRPHDDQSAQDDGQEPDRTGADRRPPGTDLKSLVEKIQFGDPDEAAQLLGDVIQQTATKTATEVADKGHLDRLVRNDLATSIKELKSFREANPELDKDTIASSVIEQQIYKVYRDEIEALGLVDASQIPTDPKQLSEWHRFYRVNGHAVSKTSEVLNKAKDKYQSWRGSDSPTNQQQARPRKDAPRVAVNVDRTERRQAIPQQPTRAVAPRRNEAPPATVEQSRKDAFKEMRKARGQPVG